MLNRLVKMAAVAAGGYFAMQLLNKKQHGALSSSIAESVNIKVPARTAYNQWTQFEEFPQFMENVHEVTQLDDTHLRWRASVGGVEKEWETEITEQIPDKRIAWRAISGARHAGVVTFHHIADNECRVMVQMDYAPDGAVEQLGDMLGGVRLQTRADLQRFKQMLESRGSETGAWRGTVSH
ncbi:MAG: SRPBCC family protein [Spongiibacteraceae bacterium]|jgi:uncharacterized membrane protein|nr:SRPBCC family protein [Spongiibacteraceae bacterium]